MELTNDVSHFFDRPMPILQHEPEQQSSVGQSDDGGKRIENVILRDYAREFALVIENRATRNIVLPQDRSRLLQGGVRK